MPIIKKHKLKRNFVTLSVGIIYTNTIYIDLCMDATRMDFRDEAFDICVDKGTYDALAVMN